VCGLGFSQMQSGGERRSRHGIGITSTPICSFLSSLYCCVLYPLVAPHCSLLHAYYFAVTVQVPAKLSPMAAAAAAASPCAVCAAAPGLPLRVVHGIVGGGGLGVAKRPDRTRLPIGFCRRRRLGVQASNGAIPTGNFFRRPRSTTGTAPPFFNLGGEESKGPGGGSFSAKTNALLLLLAAAMKRRTWSKKGKGPATASDARPPPYGRYKVALRPYPVASKTPSGPAASVVVVGLACVGWPPPSPSPVNRRHRHVWNPGLKKLISVQKLHIETLIATAS
jgi:hypothetical protein